VKKITASYILTFIATLSTNLARRINSGNEALDGFMSILFLLMLPLLIIGFFMRLKGCRELKPWNPGFAKQHRNYLLLISCSIIVGFIMAYGVMTATSFFSEKALEDTLNINALRTYQIILWFVSSLGTAFFLLVEYGLIKNIRVLGQGKDIGCREMLWVFCATVIYRGVQAVRSFISSFGAADRLFEKLTIEQEPVSTSDSVIIPNAPEITALTVISWVLAAAFIVCLIRTAVKLVKLNPLPNDNEEVLPSVHSDEMLAKIEASYKHRTAAESPSENNTSGVQS